MSGFPATPATRFSTIGLQNRRRFIAGAVGGWLGRCLPFLAVSLPGSAALVALCSQWRCPATIGAACLAALPAGETSKDALARLVLEDGPAAAKDGLSVHKLAHVIRERSRDDFRQGRITMVDGWMLSLTEARVYALVTLLEQPQRIADASRNDF